MASELENATDAGMRSIVQASHALSLFDMQAKYADVVSTAEVLAYFDQLPAGLFDLPAGISNPAAPFLSFPVMHARYSEAVQFQGQERKQLSYVLANPVAGVTPEQLTGRIEKATGLRARTTDQFRWDCILYYLKNTGIPVNFGITITIALIVGTVVAGQTFYLFTLENLKQFGTLKAIGVTNWRLTGMVLLQAFTVGVMGFGLGTGMAAAFFEMTLQKIATRGIILMWQSVAITGGCILFVVIIASLLSIRRVIVLEAAAVFRG